MSEVKHYSTATEDRIPFFQKFIYGLGALCNQLLTAAMSVIVIVLNIGLGMNPAWVGYIMAIPRFIDAVIDPIMGYITDQTKSQWGRRRPYIFIGALLSGIIFILMWQIPAAKSQHYYFAFFTIGFILFYIAYTIYAAPFIALGYEMTPDYHERTRLMSMTNIVGQFAWTITPWLYPIIWSAPSHKNFIDKVFAFLHLPETWKGAIVFTNLVDGARGISIWVGIFVALIGILPALFIRERFYEIAKSEDLTEAPKKTSAKEEIIASFKNFFKGFFITLRNLHFLKLCAAMFLVFNGFQLIGGLAPYNIIYYVYKGDQANASSFMCWFFTISSLMTSCVIPLILWFSTKVGKRNAFYISTWISIFGYALKWFCYSNENPYLLFIPTPFIAFGLGGLFTLVGSMMADVCDHDELQNGHRREGMFGAVNWWIVKLGMAVAFACSGHLLNIAGFDVNIGNVQDDSALFMMRFFEVSIPIVTSLLAMLAVTRYEITEEKAHEIREALEKKRGKATA
ncbi:MAG: hypothetical protein ACD_79C00675G0006 [uncultured bacterium]|nr:MAG: hypothetical protein ACD_79C00675G0006 [uncultured bacterium]